MINPSPNSICNHTPPLTARAPHLLAVLLALAIAPPPAHAQNVPPPPIDQSGAPTGGAVVSSSSAAVPVTTATTYPPLDFGEVPVGSSRDLVEVFVPFPRTIIFGTSITGASEFSIVSDQFTGGPYPGGVSGSVTIRFSPKTVGAANAQMVFTGNFTTGTGIVPLTGTGTGAAPVEIVPGQLDFGNQPVGTSSDLRTVTITNRDPVVTISLGGLTGATIGGANPGDFALLTNGCDKQQLLPGGTCSLNVRFSPTDRGPRSATLSIDLGFPLGVKTVPLSGFGTGSAIRVTPSGFDFGRLGVGRTASVSITIQNTGDAPLKIQSVSIVPQDVPDFRITFEACTFGTIPPPPDVGDSCPLDISFTPIVPSPRAASLVIVSNAVGSPTTAVPLTGTGFLIVTPQQLTQGLISAVDGLVSAGVLSSGNGNALTAKLDAAIKQMDKANYSAAIGQLGAFINQVNALVKTGKLSSTQAQPLLSQARDIIVFIGG